MVVATSKVSMQFAEESARYIEKRQGERSWEGEGEREAAKIDGRKGAEEQEGRRGGGSHLLSASHIARRHLGGKFDRRDSKRVFCYSDKSRTKLADQRNLMQQCQSGFWPTVCCLLIWMVGSFESLLSPLLLPCRSHKARLLEVKQTRLGAIASRES